VRSWLDNNSPARWTESGGPIAWPPRLPDLISLHFCLWAYLKETVYATDCQHRDDLAVRWLLQKFEIVPRQLPITVAARTKEWAVFALSKAEVVSSNPTQGMDVCVYVFSVFR
jgi:hypothetical protein